MVWGHPGQTLDMPWYHRTLSNPRFRSATLIQPAPSAAASAPFCPYRRCFAGGTLVQPRCAPEADCVIFCVCGTCVEHLVFCCFPWNGVLASGHSSVRSAMFIAQTTLAPSKLRQERHRSSLPRGRRPCVRRPSSAYTAVTAEHFRQQAWATGNPAGFSSRCRPAAAHGCKSW